MAARPVTDPVKPVRPIPQIDFDSLTLDELTQLICDASVAYSAKRSQSESEFKLEGDKSEKIIVAPASFINAGQRRSALVDRLFRFSGLDGATLASLPWLRAAAVILCLSAVTLFIIRARVGLVTLEFGDETEKYVAAAMIRNGGRLYADIYANHGPLAYIFAWFVTLFTGTADFSRARLVVVLLALLTTGAIACSPALSKRPTRWPNARLWAAALFLWPISALWFVHPLHMLIYHALGGYLLTVVLAQFALPGLLVGRIGPVSAGFSGACIVLAVAAAYPFAVSGALLVLSGLVGLYAHTGLRGVVSVFPSFMAGAVAAALPVAAWITVYGDWTGLYVYHFYLNQVVYARMTGFSLLEVFRGLKLSFDPDGRPHAFAILTGVAGLATVGLLLRGPISITGAFARCASVALLAFGMMMLNPKGLWQFPDTAEMISCFGLFAVGGAATMSWFRRPGVPIVVAMLFFAGAEWVSRSSLTSPHGIRRSEATAIFLRPNTADMFAPEILRVTPPGSTTLALPFMPATYIMAGRLPSSGYYYDLPFQAEYDKAPILGHHIDVCADVERVKPRAMVILDWPFPGSGPILKYRPCLSVIVDRDYVRSTVQRDTYIRR